MKNHFWALIPIGRNEEVQSHLKSEFKKWNARLNNLQSGPDKEHAQKMLDLIGTERSKYGG